MCSYSPGNCGWVEDFERASGCEKPVVPSGAAYLRFSFRAVRLSGSIQVPRQVRACEENKGEKGAVAVSAIAAGCMISEGFGLREACFPSGAACISFSCRAVMLPGSIQVPNRYVHENKKLRRLQPCHQHGWGLPGLSSVVRARCSSFGADAFRQWRRQLRAGAFGQ